MFSKETQAEAGLTLKCDECNFEGDTERELGWHMGKIHAWPSDLKDDNKSESMDISTESQGVKYCAVCHCEAEDMYDLDAHTWFEHDDAGESDHHKFCKFCDDGFEHKRD